MMKYWWLLQVEDAERFLTSAERQAVLLHLLYSLKETSGSNLVVNFSFTQKKSFLTAKLTFDRFLI
jgi:hypothetical protein